MSQPKKVQLPPELAEINPPVQLRISKVASYVLYAWVLIGIVSLAMRVFLLLFGANASTSFVAFVYRVSGDYLAPFRGIFPSRAVGETGYFDVAALFAIFVYIVLAWLAGSLIEYVQGKIDSNDQAERRKLYYQLEEERKESKNQRVTRSSED